MRRASCDVWRLDAAVCVCIIHQVAEQLSVFQQTLKEKSRRMKGMASELNMYQAQVNEYKFEIERLSRELQDVKRKYYEVKRRAALADQVDAGGTGGTLAAAAATATIATPALSRLPPTAARIAASQQISAQEAKPRFTGGGFNIHA